MAGINSLKEFLIGHPALSYAIISGSLNLQSLLSGCFISCNGDVLMSMLKSYQKNGFSVSSYVDDDSLTDEEKLKHHEELAEQALRALYAQMKGV